MLYVYISVVMIFGEDWTENCFDKISKMNKYAKSSRSGNYAVTAAIEIFI